MARLWYHGGAPGLSAKSIDPMRYSGVQNLYGMGTYFASDPEVARGYGRKLYQAEVGTQNIINLDRPAAPALENAIRQSYEQSGLSFSPRGTAGEMVENFVSRTRDLAGGSIGKRKKLQESFAKNLQSAGYEGMTHAARGGATGDVMILFNPKRSLSSFGEFGKVPLRTAHALSGAKREASLARRIFGINARRAMGVIARDL